MLPRSCQKLGGSIGTLVCSGYCKVPRIEPLVPLSFNGATKESRSGSFLNSRDLPLNVLSFLQWNIHSECFLSCQDTKIPGHCDKAYPQCKQNATEQLKGMLGEGDGALDFAGLEQLADEELTNNGIDEAWGGLHHTCGGENGFGAMPFDSAMLLYRKSRWKVKEVNGTALQPFSGCMERVNTAGEVEGATNYRAFLGQAFVHLHTRFEVVVVVAHFPHQKKYLEEIRGLSAALTSFRAASGINQAHAQSGRLLVHSTPC